MNCAAVKTGRCGPVVAISVEANLREQVTPEPKSPINEGIRGMNCAAVKTGANEGIRGMMPCLRLRKPGLPSEKA